MSRLAATNICDSGCKFGKLPKGCCRFYCSVESSSARPVGTISLLRLSQQARDRLGGKVEVSQGYGMTELSPVSHCDPPSGAKLGSIGKLVWADRADCGSMDKR